MKIVDANVILRYLLNDDQDLAQQAIKIIEENSVYIPTEVLSKVIFLLEKVYQVDREATCEALLKLASYDNVSFMDKKLVYSVLEYYGKNELDFVDALLYGYSKAKNIQVITFDTRLQLLIAGQEQ
ncbi:MAG: hypothetical protein RLZ12_758 [Bacillota bacterium]|jgi:predicted nucleic-acid-binding protein